MSFPTPKSLFLACLVAVGGWATGCATQTSTVAPRAVTLDQQINEDLAALERLRLFDVGDLAVAPEATNCYGPCPGFRADESRAAQAERLHALVDIANEVHSTATLPDVRIESGNDHLQALAQLNIVVVGELIVDEQTDTPGCVYSCALEVAQQKNARRSAELAAIAQRARDL